MTTNLLPPTSWTERKRKELHEVLPTLHEADKGQFIYLGCCIDFTAEDINELDEANDEKWPDKGNAVELLREHCAGFDQWCETMGYVLDPSEGLTVENDQCLSYGKSWFRGVPCYYVDHSRIEYIWVDREYIAHSFESPGVVTGRMSCSQPNIANKPGFDKPRSHEMHTHDDLPTNHMTPAEVAKGRAMAKKPPNYSMGVFASKQECSLCVGGTTECNHLRQERKVSDFTQRMATKAVPFEHYARQEAAVVAMGLPLGDHEVTLDASSMPDEELSKVMATAVSAHSSQEMRTHAEVVAAREYAKANNVPVITATQQPRTTENAKRYVREFKEKYPEIAGYAETVIDAAQEAGLITPKHDTRDHEQDSDSQDNGPEGVRDGAEGQ